MIQLRLIQEGLHLSMDALKCNPKQLPAEIIGRLLPYLSNGESQWSATENIVHPCMHSHT